MQLLRITAAVRVGVRGLRSNTRCTTEHVCVDRSKQYYTRVSCCCACTCCGNLIIPPLEYHIGHQHTVTSAVELRLLLDYY